MGNKQLKKQKSLVFRTFKEIPIKGAPKLSLEGNRLYDKRISRIYSDVLKLEQELQDFFESDSTTCASTRISFDYSVQETKQKQDQKENKLFRYSQNQTQQTQKCLKQQEVNRQRNSYYNRIGIQGRQACNSAFNRQSYNQLSQTMPGKKNIQSNDNLKKLESQKSFQQS